MSIGIGVFGSEHRADLKNSIEISAKGHLLVELRTLSHAGVLTEVFELEHV